MRIGDPLLGSNVASVDRVARGYTHQTREVVKLADSRRVFVKQAVDEMTADWLMAERAVYEGVSGHFIPRYLGWLDEPAATLLLEDLSESDWPPPWSLDTARAVLAGLREVAAHAPPPGHVGIRHHRWAEAPGWREIARDPEPFLALGLCGDSWLEGALPTLVAAEEHAPLDGDSFLHGDVRSDNLCLRGGEAVFVDWNVSTIGNPLVDVAFWLPSLTLEGGPTPHALGVDLPPELVVFVAGFFAARAGLPRIPHAPLVRAVQLDQLRVALPWAVRTLGLPSPG